MEMQKNPTIHIDLSYLHLVTEGDKQFEKILLSGAVADIQNQVQDLQKAWNDQNATAVRNAAHSLKSVIAIAGLPQLESACKMIDGLFADGVFHAEVEPTCADIINGSDSLDFSTKLDTLNDIFNFQKTHAHTHTQRERESSFFGDSKILLFFL